MAKINIVVDPSGKIYIDFNGFAGSTCYQEHEKLTQLLAKFGIEEVAEQVQPKEETKAEVKEHAEVKG